MFLVRKLKLSKMCVKAQEKALLAGKLADIHLLCNIVEVKLDRQLSISITANLTSHWN